MSDMFNPRQQQISRMRERQRRAERTEKVAVSAFVTVWVLGLLATLAFWGVVVWAIIKLVNANA